MVYTIPGDRVFINEWFLKGEKAAMSVTGEQRGVTGQWKWVKRAMCPWEQKIDWRVNSFFASHVTQKVPQGEDAIEVEPAEVVLRVLVDGEPPWHLGKNWHLSDKEDQWFVTADSTNYESIAQQTNVFTLSLP